MVSVVSMSRDTPAWVPISLTVTQAAEVLGLNPRNLRRYLKRGLLRGHQWEPGTSRWSIPTSEIERAAHALNIPLNWTNMTDSAKIRTQHRDARK